MEAEAVAKASGNLGMLVSLLFSFPFSHYVKHG